MSRFYKRVSRSGWAVGLSLLAATAWVPRVDGQGGFTAALRISRSAYPVPSGVPNVIVHRPPAFNPSIPYDIVVVLHGWSTCINVLMRRGITRCSEGDREDQGWGLEARFDDANRNALLVVPQLAYRSHEGHPGNFNREGFARSVVDEALEATRSRTGGATSAGASRVLAVAHSAGFETAFAMSSRSGFGDKLRRIALMDALYDVPEFFGRWARQSPLRSLVSLHTGGRPEANGSRLLTYARRALPSGTVTDRLGERSLEAAIASHRVVVTRVRSSHSEALLDYIDDVTGP